MGIANDVRKPSGRSTRISRCGASSRSRHRSRRTQGQSRFLAAAARPLRGRRAAAGGRRHLRRHLLRRGAADARDRHPPGARRLGRARAARGGRPRRAPDAHRCGARPGWRGRGGAARGRAAVRRDADRSACARDGGVDPRRGRRSRRATCRRAGRRASIRSPRWQRSNRWDGNRKSTAEIAEIGRNRILRFRRAPRLWFR